MGYALAEAAIEAGHRVTLISGPVTLEPPADAETVFVETGREMFDAVARRIGEADAAIFCAAVADYRPREESDQKIKKATEEVTLTLVKNPDILGSCRSEFGFEGLLVGFAAETENLRANALDKLSRKGCDLLVANDVGGRGIGFDSEENAVTVFSKNGSSESIGPARKREIARRLIERMETAGGR